MSLIMPTNRGWTVAWYTGKTREVKRSDGTVIKTVKIEDRIFSKSKRIVEQKAQALREEGYEVGKVTECVF